MRMTMRVTMVMTMSVTGFIDMLAHKLFHAALRLMLVLTAMTVRMTMGFIRCMRVLVPCWSVMRMLGMWHCRIKRVRKLGTNIHLFGRVIRVAPALAFEVKRWCRQQLFQRRLATCGAFFQRVGTQLLQHIKAMPTGITTVIKYRHNKLLSEPALAAGSRRIAVFRTRYQSPLRQPVNGFRHRAGLAKRVTPEAL